MKNKFILIFILTVISLFSINCATMLNGYENSVILNGAPDSIKVVTHNGIEIPVVSSIVRVEKENERDVYVDKAVKEISLRSNQEYTLHLKYQDKEKVVTVYPKIVFKWALIDFVLGVFPSFYDAYTGNWNQFPDIDATF